MKKDTRKQVKELVAFGLSVRYIGRRCNVDRHQMHLIANDDNHRITPMINARLENGLNGLHAEMREILKGVSK